MDNSLTNVLYLLSSFTLFIDLEKSRNVSLYLIFCLPETANGANASVPMRECPQL